MSLRGYQVLMLTPRVQGGIFLLDPPLFPSSYLHVYRFAFTTFAHSTSPYIPEAHEQVRGLILCCPAVGNPV